MKIAIDALSFENTQGSSIVVYISNVVRQMAELRPHYTFYVFVPVETVTVFEVKNKNIKIIPIVKKPNPLVWRLFKEQVGIALKVLKYDVDIVFGAFHTIPIACALLGKTCAVTMYDLRFVDAPEDFSALARLYREVFYGFSARCASVIITISEFTRQRVIAHWGIHDEKVNAVHLGSAHEGRPKPGIDNIEVVCSKYCIDSEFILTMANARNKNTEAVLKAFSKLPQAIRNRFKLVATGAPATYKADLKAKAIELGIDAEVVLLNSIPHEDVWLLHHAAYLFVFLSRYEGFGLPVLDSMVAGVPVICSDLCSLPELIKNNHTGFLVNPYDTKGVSQFMEHLLTDITLRERFIKAAQKKTRQFSWKNTAVKTIAVLEKAFDD